MRFLTFVVLAFLMITTARAIETTETPADRLGKAFLAAIQSRDFKRIQALRPTLPIWRKLSPRETAKLSDKQLTTKLNEFSAPKLRRDFDNLLAGAKRNNINLAELMFVETKQLPGEDKPNAPRGLEIICSYNGKPVTLAIAFAELNGTGYLIEILMSTNVFEQKAR